MPVAVITGATVSRVQVMVRDTASAALPHASVAFQVRVCVRVQPFTLIVDVLGVAVTGPQASLTVADPSAESIADAVGLQAKVSVVPLAVITGATVSNVQVMVLETAKATLPHASVAFQVLV